MELHCTLHLWGLASASSRFRDEGSSAGLGTGASRSMQRFHADFQPDLMQPYCPVKVYQHQLLHHGAALAQADICHHHGAALAHADVMYTSCCT